MKERMTLRHSLSEAAVIVGSILLAFAIDAGWDAYRARADEQAMGQWMTFEPRGGVLSSLVGDGRLGLIRDDDLREALVEWLQRLDDSSEEAGLLIRTNERIILRWNHFGDVRETGTGDMLVAIRSDPEMAALVRAKLFFDRLYTGELRRLSSHGEKVLAAIRANRT